MKVFEIIRHILTFFYSRAKVKTTQTKRIFLSFCFFKIDNFFPVWNAIAPNPLNYAIGIPNLKKNKQKNVETTAHKCSKDGCCERALYSS